MKTVTIRLTAPLQSYGDEATFLHRTTGAYPSKSAVIGLVAAALGYHRGDARIGNLNALEFAVRIDQVGQPLTDFQTVEWKKATRKITYRDYLQDAVFVVALGSEDDDQMAAIEMALHRPHFQLFLGRRANVPAGPLRVQEFSNENPVDVLKTLDWQASTWYQKKRRHRQFIDVEVMADAKLLPTKRTVMAKDRVGSFNQRDRHYGFRAVASERIQVANPHFENSDTDHDVMGSI